MRRGLIALAASAVALGAVSDALGAAFTVNTADDSVSGVCDVTHCSLREAILAANASAGEDTIGFAISTGAQTIAPAAPLPTITDPVRILGSTQPGFDGAPIIELNGAAAGASAVGLDITAGSSTVDELVINRFGGHGIQLRTNGGNTITGNYVGTDLTGTVALANGAGGGAGGNKAGVFVDGVASNTIGGISAGAGNVISGHSTGAGVEFFSSGAAGNVVLGNRIGTNAAGTAAIPNGVGVSVQIGNNTIGGAAAGAGNLISGNTRGIDLNGETVSGVLVQGNRIGTDAAGTGGIGNGTGVLVDSFASGNTIGGTGAGEGNTIAYNATLGIDLQLGGGNRLLGNLIHTNGGLGIDLDPAGVTANDAADGDFGPNNLQNFPVIRGAVGGGAVTGTLQSEPSTAYRLEFFANATCDPSGNGEGERFVGTTDVSTNAGGDASFSASFPLIAVGEFLTATATDPSGNTSEFAACVLVRDFTVYIVNSSGDSATCEAPGTCSLRWAINATNSDPGLETIRFAIGDGPVTISPTSPLPVVTGPLVLDATTQPGYSGVPLIRLDGASAGANNAAFDITAGGSTVRGFSITNFSWDGVKLRDGDGNTVEDNYIGLFPSGGGVERAGNGTYGVLVDFNSNANVIRRNVIGANGFGPAGPYSGIGIWHDSAGNVVEQNSVGVFGGSAGEAFPNAIGVIVSDSSGTRLSGNTIAHNDGAGVNVFGISIANRITENLIHTNGGLGIDLGFDGVTENDTFDADEGPNDLQNFPVITAAGAGLIAGTLHSKALFEYRLEFFASAACDPSGNGEGARFLGAIDGVGTGQTGNGSFSVSLPSIPAGEFITATAIEPDGSTSEFSDCFLVPGGGTVTAAVSIAPQAGSETVTAPARVELADVPAETFIAAARTALEAAPLGSIPLGSIPLGSIPLGSIPLGSIGLLEPQIRALLGGIALSTVPLTPPQSWESLLQNTTLAGVPLQSLSLEQALGALAAQPGGIGSVPLGSIGLRNSVLGSLTPETVGLGVAPLGSIEIGDEGADEPGDTTLDDWCEWLSGPPVNCTNPASLQGESVLSTSLRGTPLGSIPLGSIPLGSIPLGSIPLGSIPLGSIDVEFSPLGSIPLGSIPLGSIPLGSIPLGSIPLGSIDLQQSPLGSIPLGSIPLGSISTLFTCQPSCPTTGVLRDHLGQLLPNLSLENLMRALGTAGLGNVTVADVLVWVAPSTLEGYTVRQLVETVLLIPGNALTFADLLAAFLAESSLGWEQLDLDAANVNRIAVPAPDGTARYAVDVELTPDGPAGLGAANSTAVVATLPEGFAYVPGSSALEGGPIGDPTIVGRDLTWTLPLTVGPRYRLTFDARPGSTLGPAQATATADPANGPAAAGPTPATISVGDTFEANNDPGGPLTGVATSSFYLSYITGAGDVDNFTYPVPTVPGTRVTFRLSHLPVDFDLVVYGPNGQVLRDERAGTEPLDGQPLDDDGLTLTSEAEALEQQTLSDLALANLPVLGVSTLRGTEDDAVTVVSDGTPGNYVIQVTGFNGAASPEPYMLRLEQRAPVALPACQPRSFPNGGTNATSLTRGTVPAVVDTVFVVNKAQWERVHGAPAVGAALTSLDGLMSGLATDGHPSAILQVDADPDVQAAVATWNACPTELTRANAVMREVGLAIDAFRAAHVDAGSNSTVQNIVLLGGDEIIPAARLEDRTTVANEDGYAETFDAATDLSTTLRLGYFLSDDPYGDVDPIPFFDRQLHIPDVPVGRLPTNPDAAVRAVTRFTAFDGRLAPATAVTTGYEFLNDGARQVDAGLRAIQGVGGSNPPGLIGDAWNKADLTAAFLPGGVPPDLSSINGHADHRGFEPAAGSALFEIRDLPALTGGANEAFDGKLVFSMGCHAGLSVSDVFVVSPLGTADWPQAYTQRGGIYASNSGYGYGDGTLVAYSEDLQRRFAENLGGLATPGDLTIGEAMVLAKQDYFGELGLVGVYDEKAASEFTLYGLPMWQIGGPAPAAAASATSASEPTAAAASGAVGIQAAPSEQELVVEPATGLTAERLATDWTPPDPTPAPGGSYVVGQDGVQVTHFRPVEPKTVLPVTVPSAHGALITELSSTSSTPFDPYFARPIVDSTSLEPLLDWDRLVHPAKLQTVTTSKLGTSKRHRLVLATGQFTGPPGGGETGTQRLFQHIEALVFSAPSSDYAKPILGRVVATGVGPSVAFSVETRDRAPNGADDVVRVTVGYLDQPDGGTVRAWRFVDLLRTPATDRWSGAGPLATVDAQFLYFVQAVDRAGNVAVSTNKGLYYEEATTAPVADGALSISAPTPPAGGWFGGDVPVTLLLGGNPASQDDELEIDVDGKGFKPYTGPVTVSGDGPHTVTARAPDGREVALTVLIDTGPPQIVIAAPAAGAQIVQGQPLTADYSCLDAGAGVEPSDCTGPVADGAAIDTSTAGPKTFTVNARDRLGKVATKTVSYTVGRPSIVFASSRTGSGDIYTVGESGGAVVRLTAHSAIDAEPSRSADGSKIAFTSTRDGNVELYSMNADGSNVQRLTTNSAVDLSPAWSPDGTKIAFASTRTGNQFDVYVMNADGTGVQRLTTHSGVDLAPAWSPNGQKIAFSSTRTGGSDIYVVDATGGAQTRLTTAGAIELEPDWSPDGTRIAFSTNRHGIVNLELYVMNANGSGQTRLTTNAAVDITPNWSTDGAKLVFTSSRNGNLELYVLNANGSSPTRVTNHAAIDATPDW